MDEIVPASVAPRATWLVRRNRKGYEMAEKFARKLTHVSPVWYQLKSAPGGVQLNGGEAVDLPWIKSVRQNGSPRVPTHALFCMLTDVDERQAAIQKVTAECRRRGFDGVVLEAWSAWAATRTLESPRLRDKALAFVRHLGAALHATPVSSPVPGEQQRHMQLIFVVPPPSSHDHPAVVTAADLAMLERHVDGFSLMTYDYSSPSAPGPNAPLPWVHACLRLLLPAVDPVYRAPNPYGAGDEAARVGDGRLKDAISAGQKEDKEDEEREEREQQEKAKEREEEEEEEEGQREERERKEEEEREERYSHGRELKSYAGVEAGVGGGGAEGGRAGVAAKVLVGLNFYGYDYTLPTGAPPRPPPRQP
eukprot:jgi/Mesen1/3519/ME000197S02539